MRLLAAVLEAERERDGRVQQVAEHDARVHGHAALGVARAAALRVRQALEARDAARENGLVVVFDRPANQATLVADNLSVRPAGGAGRGDRMP